MQTPTLFELAEDLTHMELQLDIDEADVGVVESGQKATFTVDAYPNRTFEAELEKVWFASQNTSNVVTYPALLKVDNADLALRPGMTSSATIVTGVSEDVLMVPNAALRFSPRAALGGEAGAGRGGGPASMFGMRPRPRSQPRADGAPAKGGKGSRVFVLRGGEPQMVPVETGRTDGQHTEVRAEGLSEGDLVLVGVEQPAGDAAAGGGGGGGGGGHP
ncbi:MAG: efflux RND transporter periplasmic adaptor subunit [Deltaproteobacteria bacterium]|nr:efflux RND transporter periplasmic adaptor subunit [Deltaproteobacteria bacterium]